MSDTAWVAFTLAYGIGIGGYFGYKLGKQRGYDFAWKLIRKNRSGE